MRQLLAVRANLNFEAFQSSLDVSFVGNQRPVPGERLDLADGSRARGLSQSVSYRLRQGIHRDDLFDFDDVALRVDQNVFAVPVHSHRDFVDALALFDFSGKPLDRRALTLLRDGFLDSWRQLR